MNSESKRNRSKSTSNSNDELSEAETVIADDIPAPKKLKRLKRRRSNLFEESNQGSSSSTSNSNKHNNTKSRSSSPPSHSTSSNKDALLRKHARTGRDANGRLKLQRMCDKGKYQEAKELIDSGADVNDRDYAGNTAIHEAALKGHVDIVRLLLDRGTIIDIRSGPSDLDTPLIDAASNDHLEVVKLLLERGADPRIYNAQGKTSMDLLQEDKPNYKKIEQLLREATLRLKKAKNRNKTPDNDNINDDTPDFMDPANCVPGTFPPGFLTDSKGGSKSRLVNNDSKDHNDGHTTNSSSHNFSSSSYNHDDHPRRRGARAQSIRNDLLWMDLTTRAGREQVYKRAADGDYEFVGNFLENGWKPDADCLALAARHGHRDVVNLLLAFGADANGLTEEGDTPLLETVGRGHYAIVKLLLDAGADPTVKNKSGKNCLDVANESLTIDDKEMNLIKDAIKKFTGSQSSSSSSSSSSNNIETKPQIKKLKQQSNESESIKSESIKSESVKSESSKSKHKSQNTNRNLDNENRHKSELKKRNSLDSLKLPHDKKKITQESNSNKHSSLPSESKNKHHHSSTEVSKSKSELSDKDSNNNNEAKVKLKSGSSNSSSNNNTLENGESTRNATEVKSKTRLSSPVDNDNNEEQKKSSTSSSSTISSSKTTNKSKEEELFQLRDKSRKEREKKMLLQIAEDQRRLKEKKKREEEAAKREKLNQEREKIRKEAEIQEREQERQRQLQFKQESESRRNLPYGLRMATFGKRKADDAVKYLPMLMRRSRSDKYLETTTTTTNSNFREGVGYFIDVQVSLLLGIQNLYKYYPDLSKKLVTDKEKSRMWTLLSEYLTKPISGYVVAEEVIVVDNDEDSTNITTTTSNNNNNNNDDDDDSSMMDLDSNETSKVLTTTTTTSSSSSSSSLPCFKKKVTINNKLKMDEYLQSQQQDKAKFMAMTVFWLRCDQVEEIMSHDHPLIYELYNKVGKVIIDVDYPDINEQQQNSNGSMSPSISSSSNNNGISNVLLPYNNNKPHEEQQQHQYQQQQQQVVTTNVTKSGNDDSNDISKLLPVRFRMKLDSQKSLSFF